MDLIEALRTTGAVREYRPDPVSDEVVGRILDTARFAGFRGDETVEAERVVVSVRAVAYAQEIAGP